MKLFGRLGKHREAAACAEARSEAEIQRWLLQHIAHAAKIDEGEVDINRSFAEFGLDSMQLFELAGDLEKFLGQKVPEVVAWDYPNIALLARHLVSPEAAVPAGSMTAIPGEGNW
jgi:acyl carrier protein